MAELYVTRTFQFNGKIYRSGEEATDAIVTVADRQLREERAKVAGFLIWKYGEKQERRRILMEKTMLGSSLLPGIRKRPLLL